MWRFNFRVFGACQRSFIGACKVPIAEIRFTSLPARLPSLGDLVAALLGVAGGELLIPAIVLLYGLDIKLAGSRSLMLGLPTMIVGLARYSQSDAFAVLRQDGRCCAGWGRARFSTRPWVACC